MNTEKVKVVEVWDEKDRKDFPVTEQEAITNLPLAECFAKLSLRDFDVTS